MVIYREGIDGLFVCLFLRSLLPTRRRANPFDITIKRLYRIWPRDIAFLNRLDISIMLMDTLRDPRRRFIYSLGRMESRWGVI